MVIAILSAASASGSGQPLNADGGLQTMTENTKTVTTQRTSKTLKAQLAISMFLMIFGGFSWFVPYGGAFDGTEGLSWSATLMIVGGVWYVITKALVWWNHE
jgi:hypothetical protein